jgi:hypothetical protein
MKPYLVTVARRDPRSALNEHAEGVVQVLAINRRHAVAAPLAEALNHQHPVIDGVDCHVWEVTRVRAA